MTFFVAKSGNVPDYILNGTLKPTALHFNDVSKDRFAVAILHDQNGQSLIAIGLSKESVVQPDFWHKVLPLSLTLVG